MKLIYFFIGNGPTRKQEDIYHKPKERSPFYTMADRMKLPILFNAVPEYEDYNGKVREVQL